MNLPCPTCHGKKTVPLSQKLQDVLDVFSENILPTANDIHRLVPGLTKAGLTATHRRLERLEGMGLIKRVARTYPVKYDLVK